MLVYHSSESYGTISFTDEVLTHFWQHRQRWKCSKEAGGQLFAKLTNFTIEVCKATGPRANDRRGRFSFFPDRKEENKEIHNCFLDGLHYIGDWHTHPQQLPTPSLEDLDSIAECFKKSTHELKAFLLVIVGLSKPPQGLWVGWHDGNSTKNLYEMAKK